MAELSPERSFVLQDAEGGLNAALVISRRARFGANDILEDQRGAWPALAADTVRDPMLWFLLAAASLFAVLGDRLEATILFAAIAPLIAMDAFLVWRTQVSTRALSGRLAQEATARRDGREVRLPVRELVPGDLVVVAVGESFPADGLIVGGEAIQVDESSLTGESLPVPKKTVDAPNDPAQIVDDARWARAGVRLLAGRAVVRIVYTGAETLYGRIVRLARSAQQERTPLQRAILRLVGILLAAALALCVSLAAILLWRGESLVDALLAAATLAVAALPEEYPVVFTFFLGAGVYRLARRQALVRRAVAVENVGRTTVICTDKTGTLTEGRLALERMAARGTPEAFRRALGLAVRADSGDPLDLATLAAGASPPAAAPLAVFPFTEDRRRETLVWPNENGDATAAVKGAPEVVLAMSDLPPEEAARWRAEADRLAGDGLKVIAYALRSFDAPPAAEPGEGLSFEGLAAFGDPVRPGVPEAVAACLRAGIRVIMITGDHPAAALAIGRRLGIGGASPRLMSLDPSAGLTVADAELARADLLARCAPADKLRLVRALQRQGEIVMVTGDGVNDVPALQAADIGVAMGEGATRSARESAAVVLLDNNFRTLARAVAEGRQLFENLRLSFSFITMTHIPLVLSAALAPLLTGVVLYRPIHVVWLELLIHPTAMLAFQVPPDPAAGPGRPTSDHHLFGGRRWGKILSVGGLGLAAVLGSFLWAVERGLTPDQARTAAIAALLLLCAATTVALAGFRTWAGRLLIVAGPASLFVGLAHPALADALHLAQLPWAMAALALLAGALAAAPAVARAPPRIAPIEDEPRPFRAS